MKRRGLDAFTLIMSMTTIGIGITFLVGPQDGEMGLGWFLPTLALGTGIAVLASAVQRYRR